MDRDRQLGGQPLRFFTRSRSNAKSPRKTKLRSALTLSNLPLPPPSLQGMFRPAMLRPMGLPERVNVIAWGLSLERPTMIKYGIPNIRDLFGPKVDLNIITHNPIARFE